MSETATPSDLKERIKVLLVERLRLDVEPAEIGDDDPLFGEQAKLGLDSIDALELVVGVENAFGVSIDDEEVGNQAFASVTALADYVAERQQNA